MVFGVALDVGQQRHVVAGLRGGEVRLQHGLERVAPERGRRFLVGEQLKSPSVANGFSAGSEPLWPYASVSLLGLDLARLDVRLVEGVDPDDGARHRGGELPPEELLRDLHLRRQRDRRHRMPGLGQRLHAASCVASGLSVSRR